MSNNLSSVFDQIADGLAEAGYAIITDFLSAAEADSILESDEFRTGRLHFQKAAIGKVDKQIDEGVRGDYIQWIDTGSASSAERIYLRRLQEMITHLNQSLYLSLRSVEIHRTFYPIGTRYQRHRDQFRSDDHRKLSIICYLNPDWKVAQGGQLRMHLPEGIKDIFPERGTLVCFRSDRIEHEVLPASRERYSLTGWAIDRDHDTR